MLRVWKEFIQPDSIKDGWFPIRISTKPGAVPISVGKQGKQICVWFQVDDSKDGVKDMVIYCVGTGFGQVPKKQSEGSQRVFLGTVVDDPYVWHFYGYV